MNGQVFMPEPCAYCDAGEQCPVHSANDSEQWADSWLSPRERKHAPRQNGIDQ